MTDQAALPAATSPAQSAAMQTDAIISGGGLVGQSLALALAAHGLSSHVIDPADPATTLADDFDGRASAIASASWAMFEAVGLTPRLRPHATPIERIWVSDGLKPGELDFVVPDGEGALGYMIENRILRHALHDACATHPLVTLHAPARAVSTARDALRATVTLGSGMTINAPLLVVAEGRKSTTREAAGFNPAHWAYKHTAMIGVMTHATPHDNCAYEIFYPAGPFAVLPLPDLADGRHRSAFVWTVHENDAPGFLKLGDRGFAHEVTKRMGGILGDITLIAPRSSWALSFHHSARMVDERLVLVGDAAHGMHPIAGQGFNLGLRDVAALVEVLVEGSRLGLDLGDAQGLARYEQWRSLDALLVMGATDTLTRLFGVPGPAASAIRRAGLAAVKRIPPLKRWFMDEARGASGDLPRLLAGQLV